MTELSLDLLKARWNEVLDLLIAEDRVLWLAFFDARLVSFDGHVLILDFVDAQKFSGDHDFGSVRKVEHVVKLQHAIHEIFGFTPIIQEL